MWIKIRLRISSCNQTATGIQSNSSLLCPFRDRLDCVVQVNTWLPNWTETLNAFSGQTRQETEPPALFWQLQLFH